MEHSSTPPDTPIPDVVIVGAGAAGLATAAFVGALNPALKVVVLDGARTIGAKILVSGGGRCNVTNVQVSERDFWGGRSTLVRRVLRAFPAEASAAFFSSLGVELHEEASGKLFPNSNRARDVLDALLREVLRYGIDLRPDHRVNDITRQARGFRLETSRGPLAASRVVLATGGRSLPKSGSDGLGYQFAERLGHTIVATTPSLAPLILDGQSASPHAHLSGVSHPAELAIWVDGRVSIRLTGALLWTHFGISGPVALDASRHWARAVLEGRTAAITLGFLPGATFDIVDERLQTMFTTRHRASIETLVATLVPASVATTLVRLVGIDGSRAAGQVSRDDRRRLAHALAELPLRVTDTRGYSVAEATAGGVSLDEIDPATMESRVCRGLFVVGEMIDVDGRLGGFNFQWAWSTARVAAQALAGGERALA